MKLYGSYTSPFVRHCRIVLLESMLSCEFIETDQASSAAHSPTKRVPFLEDEKQFFTDSSSIIKYLREKAGQNFCTSAKELDDFCLVNSALDAMVNLFFLERDGLNIADVPYMQRQAARIESSIGVLNAMPLPMLPLIAEYNDVHLRIACLMGWAKMRKRFDFTPHPNLEAFFAGIQEYGNFKATEPPH